MLIRSQDKRDLINMDKTYRLGVFESPVITSTAWFVLAENQFEIGVYSSESKAIKVLDMIQNAYQGVLMFQNIPMDDNVVRMFEKQKIEALTVCTDDGRSKVEFLDSKTVFQMPSDDEVEVASNETTPMS